MTTYASRHAPVMGVRKHGGMINFSLRLAPALLLAVVAACSGSASPALSPEMPDATSRSTPSATGPSTTPSGAVETTVPTESAAAPTDPSAAPSTTTGAAFDQPWATALLTDVTTGEQFSFAGLAASGKVVFIEPMAIWCANCRQQQREAVTAVAQIDAENVEWVGLDVETSESAEALAAYREQNGFPFRYAISDTSLSRALASEFGDIVLSPPSVNIIVLGTDGRVTHLLGHHSPEELVAIAVEHGA